MHILPQAQRRGGGGGGGGGVANPDVPSRGCPQGESGLSLFSLRAHPVSMCAVERMPDVLLFLLLFGAVVFVRHLGVKAVAQWIMVGVQRALAVFGFSSSKSDPRVHMFQTAEPSGSCCL